MAKLGNDMYLHIDVTPLQDVVAQEASMKITNSVWPIHGGEMVGGDEIISLINGDQT